MRQESEPVPMAAPNWKNRTHVDRGQPGHHAGHEQRDCGPDLPRTRRSTLIGTTRSGGGFGRAKRPKRGAKPPKPSLKLTSLAVSCFYSIGRGPDRGAGRGGENRAALGTAPGCLGKGSFGETPAEAADRRPDRGQCVVFTRPGILCPGYSMPPPQNGTLRLIMASYVTVGGG